MQETYRDQGLIPGLGRSPAEGNGNPLQYTCLENPPDRGIWCATIHGVAKGETWQHGLYIRDPSKSNYSFTCTNYCWLVYTHTHTHTHTQNHKTATNHPAWVKSHSSILRVRSIIFWYPDSHERNNEEIDSCCLIITVTLLHNYHPTTLVSLS